MTSNLIGPNDLAIVVTEILACLEVSSSEDATFSTRDCTRANSNTYYLFPVASILVLGCSERSRRVHLHYTC